MADSSFSNSFPALRPRSDPMGDLPRISEGSEPVNVGIGELVHWVTMEMYFGNFAPKSYIKQIKSLFGAPAVITRQGQQR